MHALEDDWDGQDASAPLPGVVDGAISLADQLRARGVAPPASVTASVNGTVYLEWHGDAGYLEIEVTSAHEAEGRLVKPGANRAEPFLLSRPNGGPQGGEG